MQKSRDSALRFQSHKWVFRRKTHWLLHTGFLNEQCQSKPDNFVCHFMCVTLRSTPHWFSKNRSFAENGVFESEIFEHVGLDELNSSTPTQSPCEIVYFQSAQEWSNRTSAEHACSKMKILCFLQKQNGFNNKIHWYSILLTFIFKFTERL